MPTPRSGKTGTKLADLDSRKVQFIFELERALNNLFLKHFLKGFDYLPVKARFATSARNPLATGRISSLKS